jgi:uncharacterized protein YggU (UPF0235/DUF167 family)
VTEARIAVRCTPRAPRDELGGMRDGTLAARVSAPPHDGLANRALCRLIAARAGVPSSSVAVVRGLRSRDKLVVVSGLGQDELLRALAGQDPAG